MKTWMSAFVLTGSLSLTIVGLTSALAPANALRVVAAAQTQPIWYECREVEDCKDDAGVAACPAAMEEDCAGSCMPLLCENGAMSGTDCVAEPWSYCRPKSIVVNKSCGQKLLGECTWVGTYCACIHVGTSSEDCGYVAERCYQ